MHNTWITYKFELKNQMKKKSFWVSNIIMMLIALIILSLPTIFTWFEEDKPAADSSSRVPAYGEGGEYTSFDPDKLGKYYVDDSIDKEILKSIFPFSSMESVDSLDALKQEVKNETIPIGVIIEDNQIRTVVKSESMFTNNYLYGRAFADYQNRLILADHGQDPEILNRLIMDVAPPPVESLEKSSSENFLIAYFGVFLLYMIINLYGQSTTTMIASEKSNRTMEVLITSTKPTNLVIGKVLAALTTALVQVIFLAIIVVVGIQLNKVNYSPEIMAIINANITPQLFLVYLAFTLLGFSLYLFLFAASGATVSKIEDVNKAATPVITISILAFFIGFSGLYGPANNPVQNIASFIPFTAPYSMFIRYSAFGVSHAELFLSMGIMVLANILVAWICIKIYRNATLNYGNKLSLFKEIRRAFSKKQ